MTFTRRNSAVEIRIARLWLRAVARQCVGSMCDFSDQSGVRVLICLAVVAVAEFPSVRKEAGDSTGLWWAHGDITAHFLSTGGTAGYVFHMFLLTCRCTIILFSLSYTAAYA